MPERAVSRFLLVSATVCVLACLGAVVVPVATGASRAFTGSVTTSGLLGLVFALRNVQLLRSSGEPSLPPAALTTIFGGWFMLAPLLYSDVGFLPTAGTQLAGTVVSTFGLYVVVAGLTGGRA
ncbi:MAG: hypothetical protein A07HR67_00708 [uncultured archaeon A07HR67]|jgi:hypothetical protein|nr:MAG: hypothetical protein A07HR67_00708 [uncultured archaeon A07HR67]